ncbi:hypothetical protein [Synechocystis sp. PCC 7509]|uniref:hypothetical protein n=1 Tax=Synechocystis sp. PCC 7509 TaxID=927677 RepID=UPI0002AC313B|nr:hypothetical protein [Synechocystis sp. PCC 7509]
MPNNIRQNKSTIEIPAPQFDVYEFATLYWNEQERTVKVVRRWFDLEDNQWWYKIHDSEVLYPENAFSLRTFDAD